MTFSWTIMILFFAHAIFLDWPWNQYHLVTSKSFSPYQFIFFLELYIYRSAWQRQKLTKDRADVRDNFTILKLEIFHNHCHTCFRHEYSYGEVKKLNGSGSSAHDFCLACATFFYFPISPFPFPITRKATVCGKKIKYVIKYKVCYRREAFHKAPLTQLIIDHCKFILSDSHFLNSIELKGKYTYILTWIHQLWQR